MSQLIVLCLLLVTGSSTVAGDTGWLASSHPRITLRFDCRDNCERYLLLVNYRSVGRPSAEELREWRAVMDAGCVDFVLPERSSFTCKQPGSLGGTSKSGQQYALLRFHASRAQVQGLAGPGAALRIGELDLQLGDVSRRTLSEFLQ